MTDSPNIIKTGIDGFDEILQGGLTESRAYLVRGGPGCGKTTMGLHFLTAGTQLNQRVLYITLQEPVVTLRQNALRQGFKLDDVDFARPNILILCKVSANSTQLASVLNKHGFDVEAADSIEDFDCHLEQKNQPALVLLDLSGFNESIWLRCNQLSEVNIPFLIIASRDLLGLRQQCRQHGARHVFVKPLSIAHLIETIHIVTGY